MAEERDAFRAAVRELLYDSDDSVDSDDDARSMDTEKFNDNDEDLVGYVREFKGKVMTMLFRSKAHTSIVRLIRNMYFLKYRLNLTLKHPSEALKH
jgi:hypothetical protein